MIYENSWLQQAVGGSEDKLRHPSYQTSLQMGVGRVAAAATSAEPAANLGYFQGRRLAEAPTALLRSQICSAVSGGFGLKWAVSPQTVNRWEVPGNQLMREGERGARSPFPPSPIHERTSPHKN